MSTLTVGRTGMFHKGYETLRDALNQAIAGDVIVINPKRLEIEATCLIRAGVTITSKDGQLSTLVIKDREAGVLIAQSMRGEVKFQNLRIIPGNQSVGIRMKAKNGTLTLDHVQMVHGSRADTWYPSVISDTGGQGSLNIENSQIDTIQAQVYRYRVEKSTLGDVFSSFPVGWHPYSELVGASGTILQSGLQNMLIHGLDEDSQVKLTRATLGGNVQFQTVKADLVNCRLRVLPGINHIGNPQVNAKATTAMLAGPHSELQVNTLQVDTDALTGQAASKFTIPDWRAMAVIGGKLNLSNSKLAPAPLASVARAGEIRMSSVNDDNQWQATNKIVLAKANSNSLLFKAKAAQAAAEAHKKGQMAVNDTDESASALTKLDEMIGLQTVKARVHELVNSAKADAERRRRGLPVNNKKSLHMVFAGHAGTGKTTVARLVGQALYENGVLKSTNFVEARQADLVAGYKGQTAMKTRAVIDKAMDGVLFIDEAYELAPDASGSDTSFNEEAIGELIAAMENHSDRLVVIMAGYTQDMRNFLDNGNQGLKSRMNNWIIFPDYTPKEMKQIMRYNLKMAHARVANVETIKALDKGVDTLIPLAGESAGNGRLIRNYVQKVTEMRDTRISQGDLSKLSNIQLQIINQSDVQKAVLTMSRQFEDMN